MGKACAGLARKEDSSLPLYDSSSNPGSISLEFSGHSHLTNIYFMKWLLYTKS